MAGKIDVDVDTRLFDRALRTLPSELQRETQRRLGVLAGREAIRVRGEWPTGPDVGGHSREAVTSGTTGSVPYIGLDRGYLPYVSRVEFNYYPGRTPVPRGRFFFPGVARLRDAAAGEVYAALQDAKRRVGLR